MLPLKIHNNLIKLTNDVVSYFPTAFLSILVVMLALRAIQAG